MKKGAYLYVCVILLPAALTSVAPLDVPLVPDTDLIMCPSEELSPLGKEEVPGMGGSLL